MWFLPEHEKLFPKRNGNTASVRPTVRVRQPSAVVLHESVLRERGRCSDCGSAAVRPSTTVTRERTRPLLLPGARLSSSRHPPSARLVGYLCNATGCEAPPAGRRFLNLNNAAVPRNPQYGDGIHTRFPSWNGILWMLQRN